MAFVIEDVRLRFQDRHPVRHGFGRNWRVESDRFVYRQVGVVVDQILAVEFSDTIELAVNGTFIFPDTWRTPGATYTVEAHHPSGVILRARAQPLPPDNTIAIGAFGIAAPINTTVPFKATGNWTFSILSITAPASKFSGLTLLTQKYHPWSVLRLFR